MQSLMRPASAGIIAATIALSVAACTSAASTGSDGTPASVAAAASSASTTPPASPLAGLSPDQIVQKATNNLLATTSVQLTGSAVDNGEKIALDYTIGAEGCQGTVAETPGASSTGVVASGSVAILEADGTDYVKFTRGYLESIHASIPLTAELAGKYATVSATSKLAGIFAMCDMSKLVSAFNQGQGGFVTAGSATIDGQPALAFKQPSATPEDVVYVLDDAVPELLSMKQLSSQGSFFDFSKYDAPFSVNPPSPADVVDGSQFGF